VVAKCGELFAVVNLKIVHICNLLTPTRDINGIIKKPGDIQMFIFVILFILLVTVQNCPTQKIFAQDACLITQDKKVKNAL
jgi:hypothetical protein